MTSNNYFPWLEAFNKNLYCLPELLSLRKETPDNDKK